MTKSSKELYKDYVVPSLIEEFGYLNPQEVPKIVTRVTNTTAAPAIPIFFESTINFSREI